MPTELIKIPLDRVAPLIGKKGKEKKEIEKISGCKLNIDSNSGEIEISNDNAFNVYRCGFVVKAIGRGFSPEKALLLMDENYFLEVIDLREFSGKSMKAIETKRARLIGTKGKIREKIEEKTNCFISVYGKTVSIIGSIDEIDLARKAIEMILEGAEFNSVENFLRKEITIRKQRK